MKKGFLLLFLGFSISVCSYHVHANGTKRFNGYSVSGFQQRIKPQKMNGAKEKAVHKDGARNAEGGKRLEKSNRLNKANIVLKVNDDIGVRPRAAMRAMNHRAM